LTDVIAKQATWEKENIRGTLVGFWFPEYLAGINAPGYHLHFISDDRQVAGHLLECNLESATLEIDYQDQLTVRFPQTAAYRAADLSAQAGAAVQNAPGATPPGK
jgi:acetolactate decarboxylase